MAKGMVTGTMTLVAVESLDDLVGVNLEVVVVSLGKRSRLGSYK